MIRDFTFCVLAYNHSAYIIEHLESIKYQINNYGQCIDCSLIISDDASKDDTVLKVEGWLFENSCLFKNVIKIFNKANVGTCQSVINIVKALDTRFCKITASDDLYTSENIFGFISKNSSFSLLTGVPIRLIDGKIKISLFEVLNYFASDYIYKDKPLLKRLANVSIINAPNLFYSTEYLKNPDVINFLKQFDVVEDWPLQVSIANSDNQSKLVSTKKSIVLYRRTAGSTYLVSSKRFVNDQVKLFDFLINLYEKRSDGFQALLLKNRRFLFLNNSWFMRNFFNLSRFIYLSKFFYYLPFILVDYMSFRIGLSDYQEYYDDIKLSSNKY